MHVHVYNVHTHFNCTQLHFENGDLICVTRMVDGGWWEGTCNGRSGWFPGNYVEQATGKCTVQQQYSNSANYCTVHIHVHVLGVKCVRYMCPSLLVHICFMYITCIVHVCI